MISVSVELTPRYHERIASITSADAHGLSMPLMFEVSTGAGASMPEITILFGMTLIGYSK